MMAIAIWSGVWFIATLVFVAAWHRLCIVREQRVLEEDQRAFVDALFSTEEEATDEEGRRICDS